MLYKKIYHLFIIYFKVIFKYPFFSSLNSNLNISIYLSYFSLLEVVSFHFYISINKDDFFKYIKCKKKLKEILIISVKFEWS